MATAPLNEAASDQKARRTRRLALMTGQLVSGLGNIGIKLVVRLREISHWQIHDASVLRVAINRPPRRFRANGRSG